MHKETKCLFGLVVITAILAIVFWLAGFIWPGVPAEGATEEVIEHYHHASGIWRAVTFYLAIACTLFAVIGFCITALTACRLDAERGQAPAHH